MSRPGVMFLALILASPALAGDKPADPIANELAVQAALQQGRQWLGEGQPRQAVEVLEARLAIINGNTDYLIALRDAYSALVRELQIKQQDADIPPVREKLRLLEAGLKPTTPIAAPKTTAPSAAGLDPPPSKARGKVDPFAQTPLMNGDDARDLLRRADAAFARRDYAEAGRLYAQVHAKDPASIGNRGADWAYCRISTVVERLNADKAGDPAVLAGLEREMTEALALAAPKPELVKFGRTVLARVRERQGAPPGSTAADPVDPEGWSVAESANFRLLHHLPPAQGQKLLAPLEQARRAAFEKWYGGPADNWGSRCDVFVHFTANDYAKATGKDARGQGHSTLEVIDRKVTRRRIDLAGHAPDLLNVAVPREVTHVVLTDLFPDPMLPRWADEAMAILAEPRENVQCYLRALPKASRDGRMVGVAQLMGMKEFPEAAAITAFYVQSVSLVDLLVAEKGPQTFTLFLQHAQRYGYEKALKENYGFKSFAALQEKWQKKAFAAAMD